MQAKTHGGIFASMRREIGRITSNPLLFMLMVVLPLGTLAVFRAMFGDIGVPRNLPVAVCDQDHSSLSRNVTRMIDATPSVRVAERVTDPSRGRKLVAEGVTYALILLPKDLEKKALMHAPVPVVCWYNNQYMLAGSLINRDVRAAVNTVSAGFDISFREARNETREAAIDHQEPVVLDTHLQFNPYLNYVYFLESALLPTMLQLFIIITTIYAVGVELKNGTARKWLVSGSGHRRALAGKLLPYSAAFTILGIIMNVFLFYWRGVPLRGSGSLIAGATVLLVLASQSVGLLLIAITSNLRLSLSFAAFYTSTAFAFVGITFPRIGMITPARIWADILPLTHYLDLFVDQALRGAPTRVSFDSLAALALFTVMGICVAALPRLGRLMKSERYWGRM